jgi:RNA polymerase sigma-70 factor (ECF subfamily)
MADNENQLCRAAQGGDVAAATELLDAYYARIFAYFRRLCAREEDAADLTQKTFAKVWSSLGSFGERSTFSTWVHGIARHAYVDWRRRKDRLEFTDDVWWASQADPQASPHESAAERELAGQLYSLVEKLDEDAREAVHLHYYQELTLHETAEVLGVAVSTVKYRLRRALEFLKKHVNEPKRISN